MHVGHVANSGGKLVHAHITADVEQQCLIPLIRLREALAEEPSLRR